MTNPYYIDREFVLAQALASLSTLISDSNLKIVKEDTNQIRVGSKSGSLIITKTGPKAGSWHDFGASYNVCGQQRSGGDLVHFFAAFRGSYNNYGSALRALHDYLNGETNYEKPVIHKPKLNRKSHEKDVKKFNTMLEILRKAKPAAGSPAEAYFAGRGIKLSDHEHDTTFTASAKDLLYTPKARNFYKDKNWETHEGPAIVFVGRDEEENPTNIQLVFLTEDYTRKLDLVSSNGARIAAKKSMCAFQNPFKLHASDTSSNELFITEGPENAMAIRKSIDANVWACFGNSNLSKIDIPANITHITLVSDGDDTSTSAEQTILELAYQYRCIGYATRVVSFRTTQQKCDANDFLRQNGTEKLAEIINKTSYQLAYPALTIEEGQKALEKAVERIQEDVHLRVESLVNLKKKSEQYTRTQDSQRLKPAYRAALAVGRSIEEAQRQADEGLFDNALYEMKKATEVLSNSIAYKTFSPSTVVKKVTNRIKHTKTHLLYILQQTSDQLTQIVKDIDAEIANLEDALKEIVPSRSTRAARNMREHRDEMQNNEMSVEAPAHAIIGTPGLGKTRSIEALIRDLHDDAIIWVLQPTLAKAVEFQAEMQDRISKPLFLVRGRSALHETGEFMCRRAKFADNLAAKGYSVRSLLCHKKTKNDEIFCPHFANCKYIEQESLLKNHLGGGVFILTHAALSTPAPAPSPDFVIIDEDPSFSLYRGKDIDTSRLAVRADWREHVLKTINIRPQRISLKDHLAQKFITNEQAQTLFDTVDTLIGALRSSKPLHNFSQSVDRKDIRTSLAVLQYVSKLEKVEINPMMDDRRISEITQDLDPLEIQKIKRILHNAEAEVTAMKGWIKSGNKLKDCRQSFNSIFIDEDAVVNVNGKREKLSRIGFHYLAQTTLAKKTPVVIMDGTADPELLSLALRREIVVHRIDVQRLGEVIHICGKSFSNRSFSPNLGASHATTEAAEAFQSQVIKFIEEQEKTAKKSLFLCTTKKLRTNIFDRKFNFEWTNRRIQIAHFGATRGLNHFKDCDTAVLVGRKQPPPRAILDIARAFYATCEKPVDTRENHDGYIRAERAIFDKDGRPFRLKIDTAKDKRLERILWQQREAETIQALDRTRATRYPRRIFLLADMDLRRVDDDQDTPGRGLLVDSAWKWSQIATGESRVEKIMHLCGGFIPLSPALLQKLAKQEFKTVAAAKKWIQRSGLSDGHDIEKSFWNMPSLTFMRARSTAARGRGFLLLVNRDLHACLFKAQKAFESIAGIELAIWKIEQDLSACADTHAHKLVSEDSPDTHDTVKKQDDRKRATASEQIQNSYSTISSCIEIFEKEQDACDSKPHLTALYPASEDDSEHLHEEEFEVFDDLEDLLDFIKFYKSQKRDAEKKAAQDARERDLQVMRKAISAYHAMDDEDPLLWV